MRFALLALLLAACTHHRPIHAAYEVEGDVTLETFDGREVDATAMQTPNGTVFRTRTGEIVELGSVLRVTDTRRLRGAAEGLGIGAGIGALGGIILGFADGSDPPCDECWFNMTAGEKATLAGIAFGIVGGAIGLGAGAILGSQFDYSGGTTPIVTPGGPPGSVGGVTVHF